MSDDLAATGAPSFEIAHLKQVVGHFATGVTIVTAMDGDEPVGFTAQSFHSLSLDPPLVLICPGKSSTSWPRMKPSGTFCVNILGTDHETVSRGFAASGADKFKGVGWSPAPATGSPVLTDVLAWIDCRIEAEYEGGDHVVVIGRVLDMGLSDDGHPLVFYRGGYGRFES